MSCKVKLNYYCGDFDKEVAGEVGNFLKINGVSSEGETEQNDSSLEFSYDGIPGGGGYSFTGWSYSTDGIAFTNIEGETFSYDVTETGYFEVRCRISSNQFTITYDFNNESGQEPAVQYVQYGDPNCTLIEAPSYRAHVFSGWEIAGIEYAAESIYEVTAENVNAIAVWKDASDSSLYPEVEIEYEDADGNIESEEVLSGVEDKLKEGKESEGLVFVGWNGGGTTRKGGSSFKPNNGDGIKMRFHAQYVGAYVWVHYYLSGGTGDGESDYSPKKIKPKDSVTLPAYPFKKKKVGGETVIETAKAWRGPRASYYKAGDSVTVELSTTFSAVFSNNENVEVTFDPNNARYTVKADKRKKTCRHLDTYGELPGETDFTSGGKEGVLPDDEFDGWYTSRIGGKKVESTTDVLNPNNHILFAHWKKNKIIYLNPNGGTIDGKTDVKIIYQPATDGKYIFNTNQFIPSREGYTDAGYYEGWYTAAGMSGGKPYDSTDPRLTDNKPLTLWARWAQVVTFDKNGGQSISPDVTKLPFFTDQTYMGLPTASRSDASFLGWFDQASGGTQVKEGSKVSTIATRTLYAHYSADVQTVTYDAQGGTITRQTDKFPYPGKYYGLVSAGDVQASGRKFLGWFDGTDTSANEVKEGDDVTNEVTRTLYARWDTNQTVTFYSHGGKFEDGSIQTELSFPHGGKYSDGETPFPTPTRDTNLGYSFLGWYTYEEGGEKVDIDDPVTETNHRALHAHWEQHNTEYSVNFDTNGGQAYVTEKLVYDGDRIGGLPKAKKEGYSLMGWYEQSAVALGASKRDGDVPSGRKVRATDIVTADMNVKAGWEKAIYLYYAETTK